MAILTPDAINDKTKWLTRVESARYIGVSLSEFEQIESSNHWVHGAKQHTVVTPNPYMRGGDKSKPVDLVCRYYVPDLDEYINTNASMRG